MAHFYGFQDEMIPCLIEVNSWREAKKMKLLPSITTVLREQSAPGLEKWKIKLAIEKAILCCEESSDASAVLDQVIQEMAQELAEKATLGSAVHQGIEELISVINMEKEEPDMSWHRRLGVKEDVPHRMLNAAIGHARSVLSRMADQELQRDDLEFFSEIPFFLPGAGVGGTADLLVKSGNFHVSIDFKTRHGATKKAHAKEKSQVVGALVGTNLGDPIQVAHDGIAAIVQYVMDEDEVVLDEVKAEEMPHALERLNGCSKIWYADRKVQREIYVQEAVAHHMKQVNKSLN